VFKNPPPSRSIFWLVKITAEQIGRNKIDELQSRAWQNKKICGGLGD
jgi:hypothetical protein